MRTITPTIDLQDEIIANFREAFAELALPAAASGCIGADMSMSHFHLMSMLDRHGSMTMSRIAEMLGVSVSNATGLIDRIEERGLVERTRIPTTVASSTSRSPRRGARRSMTSSYSRKT